MPVLGATPKTLYTQTEVQVLAATAGFPTTGTPSPARCMAAICMVEAQVIVNGRNYADSTRIGDQALVNATWFWSYNLPQIRSLRADQGTGRYRDQDRLSDVAFAMQSAHTIWLNAGQKFTDWSTWNSGAAKAYLQDIYPPPPETYIVIGGDSLSKIANKIATLTGYPVAWGDLAKVNHLASPYTIYPGNHLMYPWFDYTVKSGDTLSRIVTTYGEGVTYQQVAEFNGITNPNLIQPGQIVRIPRSTL